MIRENFKRRVEKLRAENPKIILNASRKRVEKMRSRLAIAETEHANFIADIEYEYNSDTGKDGRLVHDYYIENVYALRNPNAYALFRKNNDRLAVLQSELYAEEAGYAELIASFDKDLERYVVFAGFPLHDAKGHDEIMLALSLYKPLEVL